MSLVLQSLTPYKIITKEGNVVPVIFGVCRINGTIIYLSTIVPNGSSGYSMSSWFSIGFGKLAILAIYNNESKTTILIDTTVFNDGTSTYFPPVAEFASKLLGISHYFVAKLISENNNTLPKIDFLVQKVYPSGTHPIDIQHGSDINSIITVMTNGLYISVGATQIVQTTFDLINWSNQSPGTAKYMYALAYGANLYVACGENGTIITSSDSINWTVQISGVAVKLYKILYAGAKFVVVGGEYNILYSTDGITWSKLIYAPNAGIALSDVIYDGTYYVACGTDGQIYGATNISSWSQLANPDYPNASWNGIAQHAFGTTNTLVVVGITGMIYLSHDRTNWTAKTSGVSVTLRAIIYANGLFVVVGNNGTILTSTTGDSWTSRTSGTTRNIFAIQYANGTYFAFGDNRLALTSTDGTTWTAMDENSPAPRGYPYAIYYTTIQTLSGGTNPAHVIYDVLTNKQWGLGLASALLDIASFTAMAVNFYNVRLYGISCACAGDTVRTFLDKIFACTDLFVYEKDNVLYLGQLYDVSATSNGTLVDSDFKSFTLTQQRWKEVPNDFEGTYIEPMADYQTRTLYIRNEAAVAMADGIVNKVSVDLTLFNNAQLACQRLNEIMQRESFPKASIDCEIDRTYSWLRPGDLLTITSEEYSVSGVFRIISITLGKVEQQSIRLQLVQAYELLNDGHFKPVTPSININPIVMQLPDTIQKQIIPVVPIPSYQCGTFAINENRGQKVIQEQL
jgi:photosystem II stability/assembly factor-like uncharacterized protein